MGEERKEMDPIEEVGKSIDYGRPAKKRTFKHRRPNYMQQDVDLKKTPFLFFPPGKEMLFLAIYFVTLPYITGLIFLFFYVSEGKASTFGAVSVDSNFFLVWTIGYELLAALIVLLIVKNAIVFSIRNSSRSRHTKPVKKHRRY
jgi:hypothetical protein